MLLAFLGSFIISAWRALLGCSVLGNSGWVGMAEGVTFTDVTMLRVYSSFSGVVVVLGSFPARGAPLVGQ